MGNEIQKDEYYLPGDLGTVNGGKITKAEFNKKEGAVTLTIAPNDTVKYIDWPDGRVCEVRNGKLIGLRQVEDAEFEVIEPNKTK